MGNNPDQHNLQTALGALKAFEKNDTTAMSELVGDTVLMQYDGGEIKAKNADFVTSAKQERDMYKDLTIEMDTWQSVINKDKTQEWVSLWYTQKWTDEKGKADSL